MTTRTIGVTGASGFLGTSLLPHLAGDSSIRVVALTRTLGPSLAARAPRVEWRQLDLGSKEDCRAFVADVDGIIHLAHTNTPLTSNRDLPSDASANMDPTLTLLQAIRDVGKRQHVVYPSSGGALYRATGDGSPAHEECPVEPLTSYGILKLAFERYLRMGAHEGWLTATVLRIGNPYGILLPSERLQGFIGVALHQLLEGRPVRVFGELDNVRDYVHLDDVCRAFRLALDREERFGIYNIGTGRGVSVRQLISFFVELTGREVELQHDEPALDASRLPPWVVLDPGKARRELGWSAEVELEDGIRQMWERALA
jgi:UDP-glucose 4-epimerase